MSWDSKSFLPLEVKSLGVNTARENKTESSPTPGISGAPRGCEMKSPKDRPNNQDVDGSGRKLLTTADAERALGGGGKPGV